MGYDTRYQITTNEGIHDDASPTEEQWKAIEAHSEYTPDWLEEGAHWYDHEDDMKTVSLMFPGVTFRVEGRGDEDDDVWVKWFRNGKMAVWRLEYDVPGGFDPPGGW